MFHCQAHSRDDHKQTIGYFNDIRIFFTLNILLKKHSSVTLAYIIVGIFLTTYKNAGKTGVSSELSLEV